MYLRGSLHVILKTIWKGNLKQHIDSVHGDVRYSCDLCDYKARWKGNLKKHIDSVHGDVRYSCVLSRKVQFRQPYWCSHKQRNEDLASLNYKTAEPQEEYLICNLI